MAFRYCSCGEKTQYSLTVPLFCASCGLKFGAMFAAKEAAPIKKKMVIPTPYVNPENDDDEDENDGDTDYELEGQIVNRRNIKDLNFNIKEAIEFEPVIYSSCNQPKLGKVIGTGEPTEIAERKTPKTKLTKKQKQQALAQIQRAATPSRTPIDI